MKPLLSERERLREFPITGRLCYLNSAGTGIVPQSALEEMRNFLRRYEGEGIRHIPKTFEVLSQLRELLGRLLGANPKRLALTFNTSHGLCIAAFGLPLAEDDVVVVGADEFPANFYPWQMQRRRGARVVVAKEPKPEALSVDGAKVIAISWVRYFDGLRYDLSRCAEIAHKRRAILCVDGIQGAGALEINFEASGVDVFAAGGQKWMLSPYGTGVLYVREGVELEPTFSGWLARFYDGDFSSLRQYDRPLPDNCSAFELGTLPYHNLWAMRRSTELLLQLGPAAVEEYVVGLAQSFARMLEEQGFRLAVPAREVRSGIVAAVVPKPEEAYQRLAQRGIICAQREGLLRFSFHIYNTPADAERAAKALKEVAS